MQRFCRTAIHALRPCRFSYPRTMTTSVPCGKYTFLKERDQLESLVERYDSFLFGACMWRGGAC